MVSMFDCGSEGRGFDSPYSPHTPERKMKMFTAVVMYNHKTNHCRVYKTQDNRFAVSFPNRIKVSDENWNIFKSLVVSLPEKDRTETDMDIMDYYYHRILRVDYDDFHIADLRDTVHSFDTLNEAIDFLKNQSRKFPNLKIDFDKIVNWKDN